VELDCEFWRRAIAPRRCQNRHLVIAALGRERASQPVHELADAAPLAQGRAIVEQDPHRAESTTNASKSLWVSMLTAQTPGDTLRSFESSR
jgi:hypothetical protein